MGSLTNRQKSDLTGTLYPSSLDRTQVPFATFNKPKRYQRQNFQLKILQDKGTDTYEDTQNAKKYWNKLEKQRTLNQISQEVTENIEDIRQCLKNSHKLEQFNYSGVNDKLTDVQKQLRKRKLDSDVLISSKVPPLQHTRARTHYNGVRAL